MGCVCGKTNIHKLSGKTIISVTPKTPFALQEGLQKAPVFTGSHSSCSWQYQQMLLEQLSEMCRDLWWSLVGGFILQSWAVPGNFHLLGKILSMFQHWFLICLLVRVETFTVNKLFVNSSRGFVFKQFVLLTRFFSSHNYPVSHFMILILETNSTLKFQVQGVKSMLVIHIWALIVVWSQ